MGNTARKLETDVWVEETWFWANVVILRGKTATKAHHVIDLSGHEVFDYDTYGYGSDADFTIASQYQGEEEK